MNSADANSSLHQRDLEFVQRVLGQEQAALDELAKRLECLPAMLRHQARRLGVTLGVHELEEVAQDTVFALWRKLPGYEGRAALETWAFRFAMLELLKALQKRHAHTPGRSTAPELLDRLEVPLAEEPSNFSRAEIEHGLQTLDPTVARILRQRHYEDQSFERIATGEGVPLNTLKARYYRGLARLRDYLERRSKREQA